MLNKCNYNTIRQQHTHFEVNYTYSLDPWHTSLAADPLRRHKSRILEALQSPSNKDRDSHSSVEMSGHHLTRVHVLKVLALVQDLAEISGRGHDENKRNGYNIDLGGGGRGGFRGARQSLANLFVSAHADDVTHCESQNQFSILDLANQSSFITVPFLDLMQFSFFQRYKRLRFPVIGGGLFELLPQLEADLGALESALCLHGDRVPIQADDGSGLGHVGHFPHGEADTDGFHVFVEILAFHQHPGPHKRLGHGERMNGACVRWGTKKQCIQRGFKIKTV